MDEDEVYDPDEEENLEWFYVEDDFTLADELAETQTADPGFPGTNFAIEMERYDLDLYEFWDDVEYGIDTYWDGPIESKIAIANSHGKRKREGRIPTAQGVVKRRRVNIADTKGGGDTVMFVSLAERQRRYKRPAPALEKQDGPWALFPDWRDRFAEVEGQQQTATKKIMPAEMRKAAEKDGADHDDGDQYADQEGDEDDEDIDAEDDDEEGIDVSAIDPEALKAVLRQRLGDAGLTDMDEEAFMRSISRMLSGEADSDDATAELANSLLGQATEGDGNSTALSGWLSQQGVSLNGANGENVEEDGAGAGGADEGNDATTTYDSRRNGHNVHVTPSDSAIEVSHTSQNGGSRSSAVTEPVRNHKRQAPNEGSFSARPNKRQRGGAQAESSSLAMYDSMSNGPANRLNRKRKADAENDDSETADILSAQKPPTRKRRPI